MNKTDLEGLMSFAKQFHLQNKPFVEVFGIFMDYCVLGYQFFNFYPGLKKFA